MKKYILRAECFHDASELLSLIQGNTEKFSVVKDDCFPDVEIEITCSLDYNELLEEIDCVEDGHVMAKSLKELSN